MCFLIGRIACRNEKVENYLTEGEKNCVQIELEPRVIDSVMNNGATWIYLKTSCGGKPCDPDN